MKIITQLFLLLLLSVATQAQQLTNKATFTSGSNNPRDQVISHDGKYLYVSHLGSPDVIDVYTRNTSDGTLILKEAFSISGTGNPRGLEISPDDKHLYACINATDVLQVFSRNTTTGVLTEIETQAMDGAYDVTISNDGNYVYACSAIGDELAVFSRNSTTGRLTKEQSLIGNNAPLNPGIYTNFELLKSVTLSPDGLFLYIVGTGGTDALHVFSVSQSDGTLTYTTQYTGFQNPECVIVSPDNKHLYVADKNNDVIVQYTRNTSSGELSNSKTYAASGNLDTVNDIVLSPDGLYLYAGASISDAVVAFSRNSTTGDLTYLKHETDAINLNGIDGISLSPDAKFVYVSASSGNNIAFFENTAINTSNIFAGTGSWSEPGKWSTGIPLADGTAEIIGKCTTDGNATIGILSISSGGELIISPSDAVQVTTSLTNTAGNSGIQLQANTSSRAQLLLPAGHANVAGTNDIYFPLDIDKPFGFGVHNITASNVAPTTGNNWYVRQFMETASAGVNYADSWVLMEGSSSPSINGTTGYLGHSKIASQTVTVTGDISSASSTNYSPTYTNGNGNGWNLISNPYSTYIQTENLLSTTHWSSTNMDNAVYLSDGAGNWIAYQLNLGAPVVASGQGFFVKANASSPTMSVDAGARTTAPVAKKKSGQELITIIASNQQVSDKFSIYTDANSTLAYDGGMYEATKFFNKVDGPQIYTQIDNRQLSFSAIPKFDIHTKHPFTIHTAIDGQYTVRIESNVLSSFPSFYIKNIATGEEYAGAKTFTFEGKAGTKHQFSIVLSKKALSISNAVKHRIYTNAKELHIELHKAQNARLIIYNLQGQIFRSSTITSTRKTMELPTGVYIVNLSTKNANLIERIVIQ